ncbi:MAG: class I SAM-dependent methyltransferase [Phycisphaerae bacterium]|nr:class I SAM-dependent methyltransferase [Phycisphaerae bacterium]
MVGPYHRRVDPVSNADQRSTQRLHVGVTAAMVMRLAGEEAAHTDAGRTFVSQLDTGAGRVMAEHVAEHWPHARMHFILRKWQFWTWMNAIAVNTPAVGRQVVVLGAGWSAMGVDWAHHCVEARVWEVDLHHLAEKERLVRRLFPVAADRMRMIEADLSNLSTLLSGLRAKGWHADRPTLWVAEGLAYYLAPDRFAALMRAALTFHPSNRAVIEFGLAYHLMRESIRARTAAYHGYLATQTGLTNLHSFDPSVFCLQSGALPLSWADPSSMELARNGRALMFTSPDDSGMRMAVLGPA